MPSPLPREIVPATRPSSEDLKMSEPTFCGKIMDLIDREATDARPRRSLDVLRCWGAALGRLIEVAAAVLQWAAASEVLQWVAAAAAASGWRPSAQAFVAPRSAQDFVAPRSAQDFVAPRSDHAFVARPSAQPFAPPRSDHAFAPP